MPKLPPLIILLGSVLLLVPACFIADVEFPPDPTSVPTRTPLPWPTRLPTLTPLPTPARLSNCPIPELQYDQHISASGSYTRTQTQAAGPIVCQMSQRCAKGYLAGNLNPAIIFKREEQPEYAEEDIFVHPSMLKPLDNLVTLVEQEWDGQIQLRITDAYDSLLEHDLSQADPDRKASLHFEGRAVDLTTWPIDPNLYPRLCSLAHCAGFDWVHNEGDHCHAAINAESLCYQCN